MIGPFLSASNEENPQEIEPRKTPTVLQMEYVECGAAALSMILSYYGRHVPLSELREKCGVSRDGVNAHNLIKAANLYGLDGYGVSIDTADIEASTLPAIVFWKFDHFVVLEGFTREGAIINDPAIGHRTVPHEEFDKAFTGVCLIFEPGSDFQPGGQRPSVIPGVIRRCARDVRTLIFLMITSVLEVVPTIIVAACTSVFTDRIISGGAGYLFRPLIVVMGLAALAGISLNVLFQYYSRRFQLGLTVRLKTNYMNKMLKLSSSFYSQRDVGEIVARAQLNDNLADAVSDRVLRMASDLFNMLIYGAFMVVFSWKLTLIGLLSSLAGAALVQRVSSRRIEANMGLIQEQGKAQGIGLNGIRSIETVKASGQEDALFARWSGAFAKAANKRTQLQVSTFILNVAPGFLSSLTSAIVLVLGALEVMDKSMTIGELLAFQLLMGRFLRPISSMSQFAGEVQELQGEVQRLDDIILGPDDPVYSTAHPSSASEIQQLKLAGEVEVKHVSYRFFPLSPPFLTDVNLRVAIGDRVALVGGSGSGKSTMAKLIAGLIRPDDGAILLDGCERSNLSRELVSNSVALVEQDIFLFEGTVRENISLWDSSISDERIWAACRDAEIEEKIRQMPSGLDAKVAENGSNFSGGERQRMEIARALVTDPSILILDEATSALDPVTERRIDQNIRIRGCTCIIIAHRLSTVRDCDEIVVLELGKVVERGTHQSLWDKTGAYYKLINTQ